MSLENGKVEVQKDGTIVIRIDGKKELRQSASGKNMLVCTGKVDVEIEGRTTTIAVNAYRKPE